MSTLLEQARVEVGRSLEMEDAELFQRLWGKLMQWAGPRGLIAPPRTKMLCVYHDDPNITEAGKLRVSVCITVPRDTEVGGEVGRMADPAGRSACFSLLAAISRPRSWTDLTMPSKRFGRGRNHGAMKPPRLAASLSNPPTRGSLRSG